MPSSHATATALMKRFECLGNSCGQLDQLQLRSALSCADINKQLGAAHASEDRPTHPDQ